MVNVFLATGFEEVEATTILDILRRGGVEAQFVSIEEKTVVGTHGIPIIADQTFEEADLAQCEMLVLPGGLPGATNLQADERVRSSLKAFYEAGKWIAAICASPMIFGEMGFVEGKKATIYPGMEKELKGAEPVAAHAVVDGNVITGRAPGAAMEFALTLVKELKGQKTADQVRAELVMA